MHYLGNNFVLMVQEAHKQGYLIDSPLHADIAATLNQHMNSHSGFGNRISLTLVEAVFDALTNVVFNDDSHVVSVFASKRLADPGDTVGVTV